MTPDELVLLERVKEAMAANDVRQETLARSIGVSQTTVWKMLTGRTQNPRYLHRAAIALGVSSPLRNPGPPLVDRIEGVKMVGGVLPQDRTASADADASLRGLNAGDVANLPVYGSTEPRRGWIDVGLSPIASVRRPELLATVRDSYALLVAGDGMRDAIRSGDRVYVNPHLPPRVEDLIIVYKAFGSSPEAIVAEYLGQTDNEWRVRKTFPTAHNLDLPKDEWPQCHVVVTIDRR